MKKFLLAMAATALLTGQANAMFLIGEPAGNIWSPAVGIEMEEVDGGWQWTGNIGTNEYFAFATQLGEPDDWNTFNANYRLSPDENGTVATIGTHAIHLGDPEGAMRGNGHNCTYTVRLVDGKYSLSVVETPGEYWGLVGSSFGWENDVIMSKVTSGVWEITVPSISGEFKFRANGGWDNNLGATSNQPIATNGAYGTVANGTNFVIEEATNITLTLDLNQSSLFVSGFVDMALRGTMNGWEWSKEYCFTPTSTDGIFTFELASLEAGSEFKIANGDWSVQYTSQNTAMVPGEIYGLTVNEGSSKNMGVAESYTDVVMTLNTLDNTFSFTTNSSSGITGIVDTTSEATYYNLHGVKVENPTNGLYIRKTNGKTEKVIIR